MRPILVTGAAGFIGFHVARRLLADGVAVVGLDDLNAYYDVSLKRARLALLEAAPGFTFVEADLADRARIEGLFVAEPFERVIHLGAQAGVRHSIDNPHLYLRSNLDGFLHILEGCRAVGTRHLVYASSSSVYGANRQMPFSVHQNVDHPISLYAATKKANELLAHTYGHLFGLPTTGLRFFTVYGPWGRPDMALFRFTRAILADEPIPVFNRGEGRRDFTYIDDVVEGVLRVAETPPKPDPDWDGSDPDPARAAAPYRLYNIGNHEPVRVLDLIAILERCLGRKARLDLLPAQPGDLDATFADVTDFSRDTGFAPATPLETGIARFVAWYRDYYAV